MRASEDTSQRRWMRSFAAASAGKKGRTSQRRDWESSFSLSFQVAILWLKKNKSKDSEEGKKKVDDELDGMSLPAIVANPLNRSAQMTKACLILFVVHRATRTAAQSPTKISRSISPSSTPEFHLRMIEPKRVVGKKGTGRQLLHVFSARHYTYLIYVSTWNKSVRCSGV